jgi:integrase-like protein
VFTSPKGGPLRLRNWRRRVFDPACTALHLTGVSPHDLRHTAASLAVRSGANVRAVQRLLGHASAAMTLDVYAGLFPDDLDAVADSLDALVPQMCHNAVVLPGQERGETLGARPRTASDLRKLSGLKLVGPVGIEPTTRGLKVRCSAS